MGELVKVFTLRDFVRESNRIEGIRGVSKLDMAAHETLLGKDFLIPPTIEAFALHITRGVGRLRKYEGMDVRVGKHVPPPGGPDVATRLDQLLSDFHRPRTQHAWHVAFEKLHPFMDGNGRTGRAIWLWQMGGIERAPLGFLHHFYYQTLEAQHAGTPFGEREAR